jgi:hypothetical protein
MLRKFSVIAAIAALSVAAPAVADSGGPYKLDKNGKCHDAKGQFAKTEMCKGAAAAAPAAAKPAAAKSTASKPTAAKPATTASAAAKPVASASTGYKLDAKGKCRDAKGKMAKQGMCKA